MTIKLWDFNNKYGYECVKTLLGHANWIWSLCCLKNGDIISASEDKHIIVWSS